MYLRIIRAPRLQKQLINHTSHPLVTRAIASYLIQPKVPNLIISRNQYRSNSILSSNNSLADSSAFSKNDPTPTLNKATNPLLDFNKTKVKNQQFSDQNSMPLFIGITERAANKLNAISAEDSNPNLALRVQVESGGCHGFQYQLKLSDTDQFKPDEEDSMFIRDGGKVLIDKTSLEILRDSKIDYVHELIGSQFKVVDSPYTVSSCGCGSSFDFDFDKLNKQES